MRLFTPALLVALGVACSSPAPQPTGAAPRAPAAGVASPESPPVSSAAASGQSSATVASGAPSLEFIEGDIARGLALARERNVPLFVDVWAHWCHTCLSMKHDVFTDPSLGPLASRLVFVAVDSDRAESSDFVDRYGVRVWPTFFIIEPDGGQVVGAWTGAASARELRAFVEETLRDFDALRENKMPENSPTRALVHARAAEASGKADIALGHYRRAFDKADASWSRRSEALVGWIAAAKGARRRAECLDVGRRYLAEVKGAALPADFASYYLSCIETPDPSETSQGRGGTERPLAAEGRARDKKLHLAPIVARLEAITLAPGAEMSADDVADAWRILADARKAAGDAEGARRALERRLAVLEDAARRASSPEAAQTHDAGRASAYVALGRAPEAVALLEERERQLPDSYEAPARLSTVLVALGRREEALRALDRAIAKSYDLRRLDYLMRKAELLGALGERRKVVSEVITGYEALPPTPTNRRRLEQARQRLAEPRATSLPAPK